MTFRRRLTSIAISWGVPAICLELIGIPRQAWALILIIEIPATAAGILTFALIEHALVRRRRP